MAGPNSRLADGLLIIAREEEAKVVAVAEVAQVVADDQWLHVMALSAICFAAADGDEASSLFILLQVDGTWPGMSDNYPPQEQAPPPEFNALILYTYVRTL